MFNPDDKPLSGDLFLTDNKPHRLVAIFGLCINHIKRSVLKSPLSEQFQDIRKMPLYRGFVAFSAVVNV